MEGERQAGGREAVLPVECRGPRIGKQMTTTLDQLLGGGPSDVARRAADRDVRLLFDRQGRHVSKDVCRSKAVGVHVWRAFLLNRAGYTCLYCRRTAWGVYEEDAGSEPPRTLRFEVDHRTTRRPLQDPNGFDLQNLVIACRSCNTIKAEMAETRFRRELRSLASAVWDSRNGHE
jgi:5-methylcytosine-specific restriction endonuclease McrA